jgi:hypothetical protein
MSAGNIFALETSGAYTIAAIYTGTEAQALAGAATGSATADAGLNEFVINGGGQLPPSVLQGAAVATATASGTLLSETEAVPPRFSRQWILKITSGGEIIRQAA